MENLENYGVQEINESSAKLTHGGSWLGEAVGLIIGSAARYAGPYGAAQISIDFAVSHAKK